VRLVVERVAAFLAFMGFMPRQSIGRVRFHAQNEIAPSA